MVLARRNYMKLLCVTIGKAQLVFNLYSLSHFQIGVEVLGPNFHFHALVRLNPYHICKTMLLMPHLRKVIDQNDF